MDNHKEVARFPSVGARVALPGNGNSSAVLDAGGNRYFYYLPFLDNTRAAAAFAGMLYDKAFAVTGGAARRDGKKTRVAPDLTRAAAGTAGLFSRTGFCACSAAGLAARAVVIFNFKFGAVDGVFEVNLGVVTQVTPARGGGPSAGGSAPASK
jgi:hypothetical protein